MFRSIVVGTDGSPTAARAVDAAAELAATFGSALHVVTAVRPPVAALPPDAAALVTIAEADARAAAEEMLRSIAKELDQRGVRATTHSCVLAPSKAILDVAEQEHADLIVVGSRGMTGARRVLGSVPNDVSHHAGCSVLIVHTH